MTRRLKVGTVARKVTPPTTQPCTEQVVYGTNILNDPGAELWSSWHGTEIPKHTTAFRIDLEKNDGTPVGSPYAFANAENSQATYGYWRSSSTNARSGSACVEYVPGSSTAGNQLYFVGFNTCEPLVRDRYPSALVQPGDYTAFTCWAKASTTTNSPYLRAVIEWNDVAGNQIDSVFMSPPYHLLSTGYTQLPLLSGFVPAGGVYCIVRIHIEATSGTLSDEYFVDDCVLQVQD